MGRICNEVDASPNANAAECRKFVAFQMCNNCFYSHIYSALAVAVVLVAFVRSFLFLFWFVEKFLKRRSRLEAACAVAVVE